MLTKDMVQQKMVEAFRLHKYLYALITMGGGKTKGSLDCVKEVYDDLTNNDLPCKGLIVAHTVTARDVTWPKEIAEYHPWILDCIEAGSVQIKHKDHVMDMPFDQHYDWVIWDEGHLIKKGYGPFFRRNNIDHLLIMTGTDPDDPEMQEYIRKLCRGNIIEVGTEEGIQGELINDYRIKIIHVPLSEEENKTYMDIANFITKVRFVENSDILRQAQNKRMVFIYSLPSKVEVMRQLDKLITQRRLLFCSTKEICAQLSEYVYHSGTKDDHLKLFSAGQIDKLASIKQLKTGSNIKGFNQILNMQINSKKSNFAQELGRLFRLDIGQIGWMYVLVAKDTQDHSWSNRALVPIPAEKKREYDLDFISLEEIVADTF